MLTLATAQLHAETVRSSRLQRPYGGMLTIGTSNKPTFINPVLTNVSVSASIVSLIFNGLIRLNPDGELESDLAKLWDVSPDGLLYTFYLRKSVLFHDGVELTAEDVKFTYDAILNAETKSPYRPDFQMVESFQALDRYTFRVVLKERQAPILISFSKQIIMPKHIYEGTDMGTHPYNFKPVGTGSFRFKDWTEDDQITLEANPDYFEGRPYLDYVVYKTYANKSEVWSALMRGEIDLIKFISREDYELTKADPAFNAFAHPSVFYYGVSYNLNDPVLADIRVRRAFAHAVNRQGLIERIEGGYGKECTGLFSPDSWAFNPDVKAPGYDPREAKRLLKEAGWEDSNGDGVLEKAGVELEIRLLVDSRNSDMRKIAMLIRQQVQEIGIKLRLQLYKDESELTNEFRAARKPQAHLKFFVGDTHDPHETLKEWHSSNKRSARVWLDNEASLEIDRLIELGSSAQLKKERREVYRKLQRKIVEEQPACFLYYPYVFHAASKKVGGVDDLFRVWMPDYIIRDFYIKGQDDVDE